MRGSQAAQSGRIAAFALALVTLQLWGCTSREPAAPLGRIEQPVTVCPDGPTLKGIDVSKWQGTINWDKVAADGVIYAFIRVSDGFVEDGQFSYNWAEAKRVGVIRGVYQFFRPGKDPVAQAELLLQRMGPLGADDLPPVIDVEATDGQTAEVIVQKIHLWVETIEKALGRRPIIYSGRYFWNDNVGTTDFSSYPLWIPAYGPTCPNLPDAWSDWVFFQFSSTGAVSGITGNVDMNQFNGDLAALTAFIASTKVECGNGICEGSETPQSCPADCPLCEPIPAVGRVVDETEVCFEKGGDPQYWREVQQGYDGHLLWTKTTSNANPANFAVWHLDFEVGGEYRLEAYLKAPWAESKQAKYKVRHNGVTESVVVDTSMTDGWLEIGTFTFAAGVDQWVRLDDNTGEANTTDTMLVADALRLTNLDPPPTPDASDGDTSDVTNPSDDAVTPSPDSQNGDDQTADPDATIGGSDGSNDGGSKSSSGCQIERGDGGQPLALTPLALLALALVGFLVTRRRIGLSSTPLGAMSLHRRGLSQPPSGETRSRLGAVARMSILVLVSLAAAFGVAPGTARANDGAFGGKGAALLPIKQTVVRMRSEEIEIVQREEVARRGKALRYSRAFFVTARYRFENPSKSSVTLQLGFPETHCEPGLECSSRVKGAFQNLRTLVRGVAVKHRIGRVSKSHRWAPRLGRVYLYDVRFAPGEKVEILHTYRFDRSPDVEGETVYYVTRTGALWNGPIGRARFTIRLPYRPYHLGFPKEFRLARYHERHYPKRNETEIVFEMRNWQPKGDLQLHLGNDQKTVANCPAVTSFISAMEQNKKSNESYVARELAKVKTDELRLCRNMIYALHGYGFRDKRLRTYFYEPARLSSSDAILAADRKGTFKFLRFMANPHFDKRLLTRDEQRYVAAIKDEEQRRKKR